MRAPQHLLLGVQANVIAKHIRHAIGIGYSISDDAALAFAVVFMHALAVRRSVEEAFRFGERYPHKIWNGLSLS